MMTLMRLVLVLVVVLIAQSCAHGPKEVIPAAKEVSVCALQADSGAYDRSVVRVSGIVAHGFEQFLLSDPQCARDPRIWLEYGGDHNSDTVYCCGTKARAPRGGTLTIDGITLPLIEDALFIDLDARIRSAEEVTFQATVEGRFFAGVKQQLPGGEFWGGYGHIGCCSLLVIQRVLAVDPIGDAAASPVGDRPPR